MKWSQVRIQGDVIEIVKDLRQTGSDGGFSFIALILHPQARSWHSRYDVGFMKYGSFGCAILFECWCSGGWRERVAAVRSIIQVLQPLRKSLFLHFKASVSRVKDKAAPSACESFNIYHQASIQMWTDERK